MKLTRVLYGEKIYYAICNHSQTFTLLKYAPYNDIVPTDCTISASQVTLLPPSEPSKIVCVGLNYLDHAKEMDMALPKTPILFLKPPSAVAAHTQDVIFPKQCTQLDYECELAVVIKKRCRNIVASEAKAYILGATCLNDVTARDLQREDGQWTRAKGFDTFCPFGPTIDTEFEYAAPVAIRTLVNGEVRQAGNTKDLIFAVDALVAFISTVMTLEPGDVVSTGTPKGIGAMQVGDVMQVQIDGLDSLQNRVVAQ